MERAVNFLRKHPWGRLCNVNHGGAVFKKIPTQSGKPEGQEGSRERDE